MNALDDWRGHHLTAPPRGYHWVQTGGDDVLVAIVSTTHKVFAHPHTCPQCGGPLLRIHRSTFDRIISLFVPVRRYYCDKFGCNWEGNLAFTDAPAPRQG